MAAGVRYRANWKIADGGMAEIFLAKQIGAEGFEKPVVLKRILPQYAAEPSFVRMFLDEAHIASTLSHSNIVQILDLGRSKGRYFLALELVDGWSLEQVRKRAKAARMKMPLPLALYIVGSLCRALGFAHGRTVGGVPMGLVHRDVSPHNVLLSREGEVKLSDFGIAKAVGRREKSLTGVIKGKIAYMSPEQASGGQLDARSDLFSVGILLYFLTVGARPFDGANDVETLLAIRKGRYERPSKVVRGFNADVERLVARALRADVTKRWQSADQLADRIDVILSKLGQPTGPSALKKWLHALGERDHVPPLTEAEPADAAGTTVELGTADIELDAVSPPRGVSARADAATTVETTGRTRRPRTGRRILGVVLVVALLIGAFWFARPFL